MLSTSSNPGSAGFEMRLVTMDLAEAAIRDTYSAPRRFMPTKATPKSRADRRRYTPRAYQPYDLMSCFNRWDKVGFGGRTGEEGDGEGGIGVKREGDLVNKRIWESCWAGLTNLEVGKRGE